MPARKLYIIALAIACLSLLRVNGQPLPILQQKSTVTSFETAKADFQGKRYMEALPLWQKLLSSDPDNANLNFLVGECLLNLNGRTQEALPYFARAARHIVIQYENHPGQRNAPVEAFLRLGDLYYANAEFGEALDNYRVYLIYLDPRTHKGMIDQVNQRIDCSLTGKRLKENPVRAECAALPYVNANQYADYAPCVSSDGNSIFFSRKRLTGGKKASASDIYVMTRSEGRWKRPVRLPVVNSEGNDICCWVSEDGNQMLIASDKSGASQLYLAKRRGKSQWSVPEPLNHNVNGKGEVRFGVISPDGKTLYFSSNRKGGFGGFDLYQAERAGDRDWGPAENLGNRVNTTLDEEAPFFEDRDRRLYFSSKGHETIGGSDIFFTFLDDYGQWSAPGNAGIPLNSTGDDLYFFCQPHGSFNYLVSSVPGVDGWPVIHAFCKEGRSVGMTKTEPERTEPPGPEPDHPH